MSAITTAEERVHLTALQGEIGAPPLCFSSRPNPPGSHSMAAREIDGTRVKTGSAELLEGTPVGRYQLLTCGRTI